jgi:predicted transcriptional regulator
MNEAELNQELLDFFKALADANRLKIIGVLAREPHSVEQLAAVLGLGVSTTSHHLSRLSQAGLVSARTDGHYYYYSLQTEVLEKMAQRLLATENLSRLSGDADLDAYDRKVLSAFVDDNGKITALPAQEKKYQVILRYVAKAFEPDVRYSEKQVNEILSGFYKDTASLRRGLIEHRIMRRDSSGSAYWLSPPSA